MTTSPSPLESLAPVEPVAVVTGASRGLGRALAQVLAADGWRLVLDARGGPDLARAAPAGATVIAGDVTDPAHRRRLAEAAGDLGGASLLVNNASTLGASPQPRLADLDPAVLAHVLDTNLVAPLHLVRLLLPQLRRHRGTVVNVSSDAAVEAYAGWGAYAAAKAALDHATSVLAVEEPLVDAYAFDPGDMRTRLQQQAFPGEDIGDRPEPESVAPALVAILAARSPSGRYRAADIAVEVR